jgi:hypothetical protein
MTSRQFRASLVAAGAVALLVGLVATFPARLAIAWFAPAEISAWGVSGTVWRGRSADLAVQGRSLGVLSWRARPARMLLLQPTWDLDLATPGGYLRGRFGSSLFGRRHRVTDLEASLSLGNLPPAVVPVGVAGELRASLQRLELLRGWPTTIIGRAAVTQLQLPGVIMPLGPFSFNFTDGTGHPSGEIVSTGGPLLVDGRVELPAPGEWHFDAEIAPGENPPRELVEGLAFVGEDIGGGRRRVVFSSSH